MCSEQQAAFEPTRIVATTRFVVGSIRDTLGPPALATQTAPGKTATPAGCGPTGIVAVSLFVEGSTRTTVSFEG
jgi:aspartate carbamoyltransferase catalytic subunit